MEDAIYQDVITLPDGRIAIAHERYDASGVLVGKEYIPQPKLQNPTTATAYSKGAVLADSTAVEVGIPVTANPNDAFMSLALKCIIATQAEAEDGTNNTKKMTPLRVVQSIAKQYKASDITMITNSQAFTVPLTGKYIVEALGSGGGGQYAKFSSAGGYAMKIVTLTKGDIIPVTVGDLMSSSFGSYVTGYAGNSTQDSAAKFVAGATGVGGDIICAGGNSVKLTFVGTEYTVGGAAPAGYGSGSVASLSNGKNTVLNPACGYGVPGKGGLVVVRFLG